MYAEDGHYYTTLIVALAVGLPKGEALLLAFYSQLPDEAGELDAIEAAKVTAGTRPGVGLALGLYPPGWYFMWRNAAKAGVRTRLHALTGGDAEAETSWSIRLFVRAPNLAARGFAIHQLGDSFRTEWQTGARCMRQDPDMPEARRSQTKSSYVVAYTSAICARWRERCADYCGFPLWKGS